jgi:PAS domain-containing protein
MDREARLDLVIGALYEAAVEPERWPAALTATADLLGGVGAQFFLWDKRAGVAPFAAVGRLPEEGNAAYARYYGAIDPRREALERHPVGKVLTADEDFDDGRFRKSEFFNDFLVPYGVPYVAGGRVLQSAGLSAVVAVLRNVHQGPFAPREAATLEHLMPHFQRTARLHSRIGGLRRQNQILEAALDRLTFGVLITDGGGRVLVVNRAAEDMAAAWSCEVAKSRPIGPTQRRRSPGRSRRRYRARLAATARAVARCGSPGRPVAGPWPCWWRLSGRRWRSARTIRARPL